MKPASMVAAAVFILALLTKEVLSEATTNATKDLQKEETSWQNRPISNRPTGNKGGWSSGGLGNTGYGGNGGYGIGSGGYGGGSGGYGGGSGGYGGNNGYGGNGYGNSGYGNSGYGNSGYGSSGYGGSGFGNSGYGGYPGAGGGGGGNHGWNNNNFGNSKGYTDYNRGTYMTNFGNNDWRRGQGFQSGFGTSNFLQGSQWRGDRNFGQKGSFGNYQPFNDLGSTYGNQIYGSGYSGDNYGYPQKGFGGFGSFGSYPREQGSYPSQQGGGYLIGNRGQSIDENRRRGDFWPPGRRQGNFKGSYGGNPQGRQHRNIGNKGTAFVTRNFASQNTGW